MTPIEDVRKEMKKYEETREAFYAFFDTRLAKGEDGRFDFDASKPLDPSEVYHHFYKLDYQARKLRGLLIEARDIKVG